jgi:hypothetical protein
MVVGVGCVDVVVTFSVVVVTSAVVVVVVD